MAVLRDEGGRRLGVVADAHGERLAGAGNAGEDVRQLEAERLVRQRERNRHHAVGLQQLERFGDALAGVDVGIDAQVGGMAERGVRIQHAVDDQIILLLCGAEEIARVVDDDVHPRVVIGVLGVIVPAEEDDRRIDLDRIDMGGAHAQRGGHVVAEPAPTIATRSGRFLKLNGNS